MKANILKGQTLINNKNYSISYLEAIFNTTKKVRDLVDEYKTDPNCAPFLWVNEKDKLTEIEESSFIYHCLN